MAEADALAAEEADAGLAALLAGLEKHLEAEADAEEGLARLDGLEDGRDEALTAEAGHAVIEGADAGQDDGLGRANVGRVGGYRALGADVAQRLLDAAKIPHAIVNDGDHCANPFRRTARSRPAGAIR